MNAADQTRRIRTVAVTITPLLCDIISELVEEQAPIDIVARLDSRDQLALPLETLAPDLVLVDLSRGEGAWHRAVSAQCSSFGIADGPVALGSPRLFADASGRFSISPKALIGALRDF